VTDENMHKELDTGPPVGREIWSPVMIYVPDRVT
jgi:hypothetical protein